MWDMAGKNIWQRKTRSVLTVLGIAMAVMLYLYMSVIMDWYDQDLQRQVNGFAGKVIVQAQVDARAGFPALSSVIPQADAEAVLRQDGVDAARSTPVLFQALASNPAPNMPPSVMAVGLYPGHEDAFRGTTKTRGATALKGPDDVILGSKAAAKYGKAPGASLELQGHTFRVVGVMESANELIDSAVMMDLGTAQTVFVRPSVATAVLVTATSVERVEQVAQAIGSGNKQLQALTSKEVAQSVSEMLKQQRAFMAGIKGTSVAVSVIVVAIVMIMAVGERKKEIGTMKALGARGLTILGLIVTEATLLSVAGGVLAVGISWLRFLGGSQQISMGLAAQTLLLTAVIGAVAALLPAWSAQRVDPMESLRYE